MNYNTFAIVSEHLWIAKLLVTYNTNIVPRKAAA